MASKTVIAAVAAAGIAGAAVLLYIASIGTPDQRVISDPIEGLETQVVENPAPPEHPAFPAAQNNLTAGNATNDTR